MQYVRKSRLVMAAGILVVSAGAASAQLQSGEGKQNTPGGMEARPTTSGEGSRPSSTRSLSSPPARPAPPPAGSTQPAPSPAPAPAAKDQGSDKAPKQ